METANEIRKICIDNDEEWFLTHSSTRISLVYLECDGEWERAQLDTERMASSIYYRYYEACFSEGEMLPMWIIPEKINGKIPGFMLLMPHGDKENCYHIEFTCVGKEFRKRGVLKSMLSKIPKILKLNLESCNHVTDKIWKKLGFCVYEKNTSNGSCLMSK
jgi:hypothetical protein